MRTMRNTGYRILLTLGLGLGGVLGVIGGASAQESGSVAVRAALVKGSLPSDDPTAAAWSQAPVSTFPMSPQVHWKDRIQAVTVEDVVVRSLHDGTRVAILLEYQDPTQDPDDAAALEFMVGDKKAHFAHGQPMLQVEGGPVNIWYWKNKDNKGVDMTAMGFGTLKAQADQDVTAKGVYEGGKWRVVFSRDLSTANLQEDTQIKPGDFLNIAFAVWDGQKLESGEIKEHGSMKAVSSWWYYRAEPPPDYSAYWYALLAMGIAAAFQFFLIRNLKKGTTA